MKGEPVRLEERVTYWRERALRAERRLGERERRIREAVERNLSGQPRQRIGGV